jgi:regulator of sigma E protease
MLLLILGLILFVGLVVIHEWGHFIMARRNGVEVEEFGIGFPPAFYKKRIKSPKGDYNFTLNVLPLGGFVKLKGEHDTDTAPGSFGAAPLKAKTKIMAAGVVMNLIVAFVLLTVLAAVGMPKLVDNQYTVPSDTKVVRSDLLIGGVEDNSPAAKAGLKSADILVSVGPKGLEQKLNGSDDLPSFTKTHAGKTVSVTYTRAGEVRHTTLTIRPASEVEASLKLADKSKHKGYIGVYPTDYVIRRSTWSAPVVGAGLIGQFTSLTFQGLGKAVAGLGMIIGGAVTGNTDVRVSGQKQASEQVSGPLGIFMILKQGTGLGLLFILMIIAIISLTLAIMNILPIPALDGGRLWIMLFTRAIHKPLSPEREELINAGGFIFLMGLIVLITIVDVRRFF